MSSTKLTYSEKLKDPRWQRKRLEVMQRDNFCCTICGDGTKTLNVHHESYKGEPWEQDLDKLTTLCESCHGMISMKNDICGKYVSFFKIDPVLYFLFEKGAFYLMKENMAYIPISDLNKLNDFYNESKLPF